jgi:elongation factor G
MHFPEPVISHVDRAQERRRQAQALRGLGVIRREDPSFRSTTTKKPARPSSRHGRAAPGDHPQQARPRHEGQRRVGKPRVSYREAITRRSRTSAASSRSSPAVAASSATAHHLEPFTAEQAAAEELDFTDNIAFENGSSAASIPKEFIPSIEYGVRQTAKTGVKFGYPLINVKATLVYGSYHDVDSSQVAFEQAGRLALIEAVERAGPVLLEPIMKVVVTVPNDYLGNVTGDISPAAA